jgi:hypothetical protein
MGSECRVNHNICYRRTLFPKADLGMLEHARVWNHGGKGLCRLQDYGDYQFEEAG